MARLCAAVFTFFTLFILNVSVSQAKEAPSRTRDYADTVTVQSGETEDNMAVRDAKLVIAGHVLHDVLAIDCSVTLRPGAFIGGSLVAVGGTVNNQAGSAVRVVRQTDEVLQVLNRTEKTRKANLASHNLRKWYDSQLVLLVVGLLSTLFLNFAAPRAASRALTYTQTKPSRCLSTGAIAGGALFVCFLILGWLTNVVRHTPLIAGVVALQIAIMVLLAAVWLCGMRVAGDLVARKMGTFKEGRSYLRMAIGLFAFYLLNMLLGRLLLGGPSEKLAVIGLILEAGFGLMGLGAFLSVLSNPLSSEEKVGAEVRLSSEAG